MYLSRTSVRSVPAPYHILGTRVSLEADFQLAPCPESTSLRSNSRGLHNVSSMYVKHRRVIARHTMKMKQTCTSQVSLPSEQNFRVSDPKFRSTSHHKIFRLLCGHSTMRGFLRVQGQSVDSQPPPRRPRTPYDKSEFMSDALTFGPAFKSEYRASVRPCGLPGAER